MDGKLSTRLGEVSEIAGRHSPSSPTQIGDLDKSVIGQLFGMMRLSYPNFLTNKSDDEIAKIKRLWYVHLNGSDPKHIMDCAKTMVDRFQGRAPTIGEFKDHLREHQQANKNPVNYPQLCKVCRAYDFTQYHQDICVTGEKRLPIVTDEQIAEVKAMFKNLR